MLTKLTIKTKLLVTFIIVSLIPLVIVTLIAINKASEALQDEAVAKFTAVQETKRNHVKDYFLRTRTSVKIIKNDPYLQTSMSSFNDAYEDNNNTVDNDVWRTIVEFRESPIKDMVKDNEFYDLLMISPIGNVVYSTARGSDMGMNIPGSELAGSSLGKAFAAMEQAGDDDVIFADFAAYSPSNGEQAAFMMARMKNRRGQVVGSVAIRITGDKFNKIVQQRNGMGEMSESYLVGRVDGEVSLRSDRVVKAGHIGESKTDKFIELALGGESGFAVKKGSDEKEEFVRYDPVDIPGLDWAMITSGATSEVFGAVTSLRNTMMVIILVVIVLVIGIAMGMTALVIRPIKDTVAMLKDIAEGEGDLTKRLSVDSQDEMGEMATWFNSFMEKIHGIIQQISLDATTLNDASSALSAISGQMTEGVGNMSQRSEQVATASEEMSVNMNSVAAASEQASSNVNMVASATEEMTATVSEIAQNSEKARIITESAVRKAVGASAKVDELGRAANEISKVTEVITEISEQTNLLALNATIEAARAGEAGKGFAVVANEIKELARQTAAATQEIKNRIDGIQSSTDDTVKEIGEISDVINEVNEIVATIATAVEEQAATSQEISNNVAQASQGIQEVNENVNQSSAVAGTITSEIMEVNTSVQEIADSSNQVKLNSDELLKLADKLRELVGRFKV